MATIAAVYIGADSWNADVYEVLSFASRLAAAIKERNAAVRLARFFGKLNRRMDDFFDEIQERLAADQDDHMAPPQPVDYDRVNEALKSLLKLHVILDGIYQRAVRHRLTNHSLLSGSLRKLHRNDERVVELAEWIRDVMHPEAVEEIFSRARSEYDRGDTVALSDR